MRWPWQGRGRHARSRVVFIGTSPFEVAEVVAAAPVQEEPKVRLGFADGSTMALADDDPRSRALRDAAASLVGREAPSS